MRRIVVAQADAVGVAEHGGALAAARPVLAGVVFGIGEGGAVGLRAREDIVHVGRVAAAVDDGAFLGEVVLFREVIGAVQLGHVLGDDDAFGILPRALADAVARIDRARPLRREIGVPGLGARARGLRELLALRI